jgi:hypothetical protein
MLHGHKWLASHPEKKAVSTSLMGGLVVPISHFDTEQDNLLPLHEFELQFLTCAAHALVTVTNELSWLP